MVSAGSYGVGTTRHLTGKGVRVVEVDRPNRQARHRAGKTDAIAAARAALTGTATGSPKSRTGNIEAIRSSLGTPLRGRADAGLVGQDPTPSPQPWRQPASQLGLYRIVLVRMASDERRAATVIGSGHSTTTWSKANE